MSSESGPRPRLEDLVTEKPWAHNDLDGGASLSAIVRLLEHQGGEVDALTFKAIPGLRILIVDDDESLRSVCSTLVLRMGFFSMVAGNVPEALLLLEQHSFDMLLLDLRLPGGGGLELLRKVRSLYPYIGVVIMTAYATVSSAVEAMQIGAGDYLTKPFSLEQLSAVLDQSTRKLHFDNESRRLREQLRTEKGMGGLIGTSPVMEKMYRILSKVALCSHHVLITGESGTGKELIAKFIHANGRHATKPFVTVDCGSLVPTLIESELFGHLRGAFTGANRPKEGLLVAAESGTVFLDEIGDLPLDMQAKLLRALQEKEVRPVGGTHTVPIAARVLAATHRDLEAMVAQGTFRRDLYFRLNVMSIKVPPLRDRREDIRILVEHFLECSEKVNGKVQHFSEDALSIMNEYDWPGNVRELQHAIQRSCAMSLEPVLYRTDLPSQFLEFDINRQQLATSAKERDNNMLLDVVEKIVTIADLEKQTILSTIEQLKGDKLAAARLLGIGKTTLYRKLKEYGLGETVDPAAN